MLDDNDRYGVIQLIVVSESTSWNRFYNFLVFASLLILAWTAVYIPATQATPPKYASFIMALMSAVGFLSGLAWAVIGWRGRRFLNHFLFLGRQLEERTPAPAEGAPPNINPCQQADLLNRKLAREGLSGFLRDLKHLMLGNAQVGEKTEVLLEVDHANVAHEQFRFGFGTSTILLTVVPLVISLLFLVLLILPFI